MIADDLLTELYLQAPRRPEGWQAAFVHATSAIALLRYHAAAAAPLGQAERFARLAGVRDYRYFPLDQTTIDHADVVLHIPTGIDAAVLADRILALPGVEQIVASAENGSPEGAWGDRFFYVGPHRRQPFATIVEHDVPSFDPAGLSPTGDADGHSPEIFR